MGDILRIDMAQTVTAAQALRTTAQDATAAGARFIGAGQSVSGQVEAGESISASAGALGARYGSVCAELAASAQGLGDLVQQAAAAFASVEDTAVRRFGALRPI